MLAEADDPQCNRATVRVSLPRPRAAGRSGHCVDRTAWLPARHRPAFRSGPRKISREHREQLLRRCFWLDVAAAVHGRVRDNDIIYVTTTAQRLRQRDALLGVRLCQIFMYLDFRVELDLDSRIGRKDRSTLRSLLIGITRELQSLPKTGSAGKQVPPAHHRGIAAAYAYERQAGQPMNITLRIWKRE